MNSRREREIAASRLRFRLLRGLLVTAVAVCAVAVFAGLASAQGVKLSDGQRKALMLYKFAQSTEWPASAFADTSAPFVLGILGSDPPPDDLKIIEGKPTHNHKVAVKRYRRAQEVTGCQMLFVAASEDSHVVQTLKTLSSRSGLLTVGESERFFQHGGMVTFVPNEDKDQVTMGLEINPTTAARSGLKLAGELLEAGMASRNYHLVPDNLLEIAKETDWPPATLPEDSVFVVGILGTNCFGADLDRLQNKKVKSRKVVVKKWVAPEEVEGCQILYIASTGRNDLLRTLKRLGHASVLTIGEAEDFLELGGMVNVVVGKNTLCFELNKRAADEAHLGFNSQLMDLASR